MLLDSERESGRDTSEMPSAPEAEPYAPGSLMLENIIFEQGRLSQSARRVASSIPGVISDPVGTLRKADLTLRSALRMTAPAFEPLSPLLKPRSLSCRFDSVSASLSELKAAGKKAGGSLNDALLAAVAGAFRRYHDHHGVSSDAIRLSMPINLRQKGSDTLGGNQFAPVRFPLPVTIDDPAERIVTIRELVLTQRAEPALTFADGIAGVLNRLPTSVTTSLFGGMLRGVDCTVSNVPGLPFEVFLGGARLESQFPFGPLAGAAVNITLLSYLDDVNIGVNTDPAAVPDPEVFVDCLQQSLMEVVKI
jgi:WS/DGAT/MGAT family acyltransferase